jgi:hypothetical protein
MRFRAPLAWLIVVGAGCAGTTGAKPGVDGGTNTGGGAGGSTGAGGTTGLVPVPPTSLTFGTTPTNDQILAGLGMAAPASNTDLSGTWDLVSQRPGRGADHGVVLLAASTFAYISSSRTLQATGIPNAPAVRTINYSGWHAVATTSTPTAMSLGKIPTAVGGSWSFVATPPDDPSAHCEATMSPSLVSGACTRLTGAPRELPGLNGSGQGSKVAAKDSIFGDLGGDWELNGSPGHCTVTFAANTLTATCDPSGSFTGGSVTVVVGDDIASGTTSMGFEFAARRR